MFTEEHNVFSVYFYAGKRRKFSRKILKLSANRVDNALKTLRLITVYNSRSSFTAHMINWKALLDAYTNNAKGFR